MPAGADVPPDEAMRRLGHWLNPRGQLVTWPARQGTQRLAAAHLVAKFERGRRYSEREVNELLSEWHLFRDPAILRRSLYDWGHLDRTPDGAAYWLPDAKEEDAPD